MKARKKKIDLLKWKCYWTQAEVEAQQAKFPNDNFTFIVVQQID